MFDKGRLIYHWIHVPVPVAQSSADSTYNAACTAGMDLAHFRILNDELLNKNLYMVTEQAPIIILNMKAAICMDKNGKDTKQTRNISRRMHLVRNGKEWNLHKTVWCEGGMQLEDIGTNNVREY